MTIFWIGFKNQIGADKKKNRLDKRVRKRKIGKGGNVEEGWYTEKLAFKLA